MSAKHLRIVPRHAPSREFMVRQAVLNANRSAPSFTYRDWLDGATDGGTALDEGSELHRAIIREYHRIAARYGTHGKMLDKLFGGR